MLKRLWRFLFGEPENPLQDLVTNLLASQQEMQEQQLKTQQAVMDAVQTMGNAAAKQAEVLSSYLQLFKTTEAPETWSPEEVEKENYEKDLIKAGFPVNGSDKEQAEFILKHLELFE